MNRFNSEVRQKTPIFDTALSALQQAKADPQSDTRLIGSEYNLFINGEEVTVRANNLAISAADEAEMEQNSHYYDEKNIAFCGLEDFERFPQSYFNFIA